MKGLRLLFFIFLLGITFGCGSESTNSSSTDAPYSLNKPKHFPNPTIPADNPLTVNKIQLGRMLFYDKRISEDGQVACSNCHQQRFAFSSDKPLDKKVHGGMTTRNSMVLFNLAFANNFFWDGRTTTLEATCLDALRGEQKFNIGLVTSTLMKEQRYIDRFKAAFNTSEPTEDMVVKSLASFIRTMVSGNSKVDRGIVEGNINKYLSVSEIDGKAIFETEDGDCFHCHGDPMGAPMMTDNLFHNNGLDSVGTVLGFRDPGKGLVTGVSGSDAGKFKTGALRNLSFSAPFMHDGRFPNLDAVLHHYNNGIKKSPTIDPNMKKANQGGLQLTPSRLASLKTYLLSFDDPSFIQDTSFQSPF